jgi:hypothetical protein
LQRAFGKLHFSARLFLNLSRLLTGTNEPSSTSSPLIVQLRFVHSFFSII